MLFTSHDHGERYCGVHAFLRRLTFAVTCHLANGSDVHHYSYNTRLNRVERERGYSSRGETILFVPHVAEASTTFFRLYLSDRIDRWPVSRVDDRRWLSFPRHDLSSLQRDPNETMDTIEFAIPSFQGIQSVTDESANRIRTEFGFFTRVDASTRGGFRS